MKKYLYTLFTAALLLLSAGCSKDDSASVESSVVGEWHMTMWNEEAQADFEVYLEFAADGRFNIYQQIETSDYVKYSGSFKTSGSRLSGRYSDGVAWGSDYTYALSNQDRILTMTSLSSSEVSTYVRTTIPDAVRAVRTVRSQSDAGFDRVL